MNRKVITLLILLCIATPLNVSAETNNLAANTTEANLGISSNNPEVAPGEIEGGRMQNTLVAAATGAAIGSVWPGIGTVIGLAIGGAYGFFFK